MSVIDLRVPPRVITAVPVALYAPVRARIQTPFWVRMAVAAGLTAVGYVFVYADVLAEALSGSRTVFVTVVPALLVMVAMSHRTPARGVGDGESDWIVATLIGAAGFLAIHLVGERFPTLSGLWRLPTLGIAVWFACLLTLMFGVRHMVRMWGLWLFALCATTPLPLLLATAALGGSDTAAVLVAAAFGAVAVVLATPTAPRRARVLAGLGCYLMGATIALTADSTSALLVSTVLAAGVLPAVTTAVVHLLLRDSPEYIAHQHDSIDLPQRSTLSIAVLVAVATVLMLLNPFTGSHPTTDSAAGDWIKHTPMGTPTNFPFIARYLGPGARLDRYAVPSVIGMPAAAIDVITTENPTALDDFANAVWYPSSRPVDYRAADPSESMPSGARIVHSNADASATGADAQWYAVTWVWAVGALHQQVTVVVNQALTSDRPPPEPAPLSLLGVSLRPALWVARQQPNDTGSVDELVTARARDLVAQLISTANHRNEGPTGA